MWELKYEIMNIEIGKVPPGYGKNDDPNRSFLIFN